MLPPGFSVSEILKRAVMESHQAVEVLPPGFLSGSEWGLFADREDRSILLRILDPVRDPADLTFTIRDSAQVAKAHPSLEMIYVFLPESQESILECWIQTAKTPEGMSPNTSIRFFSYGVLEREGWQRLAIHEKAMMGVSQEVSTDPDESLEEPRIPSLTDEWLPELTPMERKDIETIRLDLRRILEGDPTSSNP